MQITLEPDKFSLNVICAMLRAINRRQGPNRPLNTMPKFLELHDKLDKEIIRRIQNGETRIQRTGPTG